MSCGASSSGNYLPHKKGIDVARRGEEETGTQVEEEAVSIKDLGTGVVHY